MYILSKIEILYRKLKQSKHICRSTVNKFKTMPLHEAMMKRMILDLLFHVDKMDHRLRLWTKFEGIGRGLRNVARCAVTKKRKLEALEKGVMTADGERRKQNRFLYKTDTDLIEYASYNRNVHMIVNESERLTTDIELFV